MDITNCYKSEDYGNIFRYFFELYIIAFTMGVATDEFEESRKNLPNINIDSESEVLFDRVYIMIAMIELYNLPLRFSKPLS